MLTKYHKTDFCVVGGGLAGVCAAIAAARRGSSVILMHDMNANRRLDFRPYTFPATMVRSFRIEYEDTEGKRQIVFRTDSNYQRLVRIPCNIKAKVLYLIPEKTWGSKLAHIFAWDVR